MGCYGSPRLKSAKTSAVRCAKVVRYMLFILAVFSEGVGFVNRRDIFEHLAELEDIPGTCIFTAARARQGYWMNQCCFSLLKDENRQRFKADERAYLDEWPMTEEQKQAIAARDFNRAIEMGGNIFYLAKVAGADGLPFIDTVSSMTGMSVEDYRDMLSAGGRSPEGNRSKKEGR